ncbi:hypothetical protein [Streptomyces sp. NBC_01244]|nr:hypothetical protein OG247_34350 [Streptomyces sp. NBC_01244]
MTRVSMAAGSAGAVVDEVAAPAFVVDEGTALLGVEVGELARKEERTG